jgi:hypothetical protein
VSLIAAAAVMGFIAASAMVLTYNGGQMPAAFSAEYVPPKQMNGIAIESGIEGKQTVLDQKLGDIFTVETGTPVNVISNIKNVDNPQFEFAGNRDVIEVFNANGTRVWGSDSIHDALATNLKPGDQITVGEIWPVIIIKEPSDLENGSYEYLPAPSGVYTIRSTFEGGDVELSNEITVVVGDVS